MAYCRNCGSEMTRQLIENRLREVCPTCGTVFYEQWRVSAGVRVVNDGKLLLVQRAFEPWKEKWHMPAGYVEADEEPAKAAEREVLEETGLTVRAGKLIDCYTDYEDPRGNVLVLLYEALNLNGKLTPSEETISVGFFTPEDIQQLPLAGMSAEKEISDWFLSIHG